MVLLIISKCEICGNRIGIFTPDFICCKCHKIICSDCLFGDINPQYISDLRLLGKLGEYDVDALSARDNPGDIPCFCESCCNEIITKLSILISCTGESVSIYGSESENAPDTYVKHVDYKTEKYTQDDQAVNEIRRVAEFLGSNTIIKAQLLLEQDNSVFSVGRIIF